MKSGPSIMDLKNTEWVTKIGHAPNIVKICIQKSGMVCIFEANSVYFCAMLNHENLYLKGKFPNGSIKRFFWWKSTKVFVNEGY